MKRRCVFLDRDGTINVSPAPGEYLLSWEEFQFLPAVVDWIRLFNALDFLVVVVTNQRAVARGILSVDTLEDINRRMVEALSEQGARIDDVLYCPHEIGECECRKPAPGMVDEARKKWNIDLEASLMIGDSDLDQQLAASRDIKFIRVRDGRIEALVSPHRPP